MDFPKEGNSFDVLNCGVLWGFWESLGSWDFLESVAGGVICDNDLIFFFPK